MEWFDQLQTFMPHGMCLLWKPELMILHIGSDALIALAYFAIPFGIAQFVSGRTDLDAKHRYLALLFAGFIGLCGVTHVASILVLWYPYYVTEGWLKAVTAAASMATAVFAHACSSAAPVAFGAIASK
jgi:two-component system sensor kinase FixL